MSTPFTTGWLARLQALWQADNLPSVERRRAQRVLMLGCSMLMFECIVWSLYFAFNQHWLPMSATVLMLGCAIGSFVLITHERPGWTERVLFAAIALGVTGMALVFDAPTVSHPRTLHLFLLPMGVTAFMTFRSLPVGISMAMSAACLGLFGWLEVSQWVPFPSLNLSDGLRALSKWLNMGAALALLLLLLSVLNSDAKRYSDRDRELQIALEQEQFVLYYQPKLDQHQQVTGAEVLVRWQHPQRGLLPPGAFIDHAERNGLMAPLGQWILKQACAQLAQWQKDPVLSQLELAVNVSQAQFRQEDFVQQVLDAVQHHGIPPQRLELELTETLMVLNMDDLLGKMQQLQAHGLRFSLDDFGTGFSSLSLLRQLPLHTLKIDRSFVTDLPHDSHSTTIVKTLLDLAQQLQLSVVAEGIEQPQQHAFLVEHGCPSFQGYLYSKPLPLHEFLAFVRRQRVLQAGAGLPTDRLQEDKGVVNASP